MSYKTPGLVPQDCPLQIHYIYYEVINRYESAESVVHSVNYERIMECLDEKNYILRKEDIVYLLTSDGAHFFEDSLRIYDSSENTYFQVPNDWELEVDDYGLSLTFWVKSRNPNSRKKLDDITEDLKSTKEKLSERLKKVEGDFKSNFEKVYIDIDDLSLKIKILFNQLAKLYEKPPRIGAEDPSPLENKKIVLELENSQENFILEGPVKHASQVESGSSKHIGDSNLIHGDRSVSQRQTSSVSEIDIALMYSEPLVRRDGGGMISLGDPVEYEEECSRVIDMLKKKEKKINMYFEIASINNLVNVLSLNPTVLHIMCHGDFNKTRNQFFLCFEENGELVELYSEGLRDILKKIKNFNIQLVFINACHSEEVAKVFMDAGVSCVLAVHSELKIEDSIARKFSEAFYWQLFEGKTIEQAYTNAAAGIAGKNVYTCCCAHSHKSDCAWYKLAKEEGFEKAHYLHTPTCTECSTKFGNKFIHKDTCMWGIDFLQTICGYDDFPQGNFFACCCSAELEHNEGMKFKLFFKEELMSKQVLFKNKESGKVNIRSTHSCVEPKFHISKMTGRNKDIHEIFGLLMDKDKKIVNLYGCPGVGKTTLAKQVANYMVERGYFKEKICLLKLEKTPGITHFISNLFKEVPGSENLNTFCQSIKTSHILFILAKCDKLIADHYEKFRRDLAFITERASNVKFIIITQRRVELELKESHVLMKELRKIDAAKLLCKHAFNFLDLSDRNIYTLADNGIFDMVSLTPQAIWSISEKLKNDKSLREIEKDLTLEKVQYNATSEQNKIMDETTQKTLENIRKTNPEAYNLLTFISLFPSGLSFQDLEELSTQGKIAKNWKETLYDFLRKKAYANQYQYGSDENGLEEIRGLDRSESVYKKEKEIEKGDFKPDNYIWISITKEPADNELWFLPTQFITRYVERKLESHLIEQCIVKHEYMAQLTISLIERVKANNNYIEKLLESSAVSTYGIWRNPHKGGSNVYNKVQYLNHASYDFDRMKRLVGCHEPNLLSCLESKFLDCLFRENDNRLEHVINIIESIYLGVPTLFKLISVKEFGAGEVARKAEQELNKFITNPRILVTKFKIDLFLIALYLGSKIDASNTFEIDAELQSSKENTNFDLAKIQLQSVEEQEDKYRHIHELVAEVQFTKALYYYKAFKNKSLNSNEFNEFNKFNEFPKKAQVYLEINNLLRNAKSSIKHLSDNEHYKVFIAKIALVQTKTILNRASIQKKHLDDMHEALGILTKYESPRLLMKANYLYASLKFELEKNNVGMKTPDNSASEIKRVTSKLVEIKNVYLVGAALGIAKKIKSNLYESKVKRMIDEINIRIRHTYFNVIIIMRSAPIVDIKQLRMSSESTPRDSTYQIIPTGFPTKLASSFKRDVTQVLSASNKVVCLKFEVLTKDQLIDSLFHGCRVLQLTCCYVEQNCLCVEGTYGTVERITFEELKEIFSSKLATSDSSSFSFSNSTPKPEEVKINSNFPERALRHGSTDPGITQKLEALRPERPRELTLGPESSVSSITRQPFPYNESKVVDVLILAVKNNPKLVELFVELGIPHIITFEFLSNESNFRHKNYEDECIESFSLFFYKELLAQKSVTHAYNIARNKVFDALREKYFEGKPASYVTSIIGAGPKLFPENDDDHNEVLFGSRFPLVSGKLEDISSSRCPTNIEKILIPFTGRNLDMYNAMKKVHEKFGFLKVTGAPGIGKTTFVLQLGYHILSRNLFPDGVFYIPLKRLKYRNDTQDTDYQMKDLLKETLGLDAQLGFSNFFKEKRMLLIFDDFDLFYKRELEFPSLLFLTLKDHNIPSILVTSTNSLGSEVNAKGGKNKYKKLTAYNQTKKEIDNELLHKDSKLKLEGLSEEELALILQSLIKTDSYKDFASIEELKRCPQVRHAQGNPRYIVDKLVEGKLEVLKIVLKVSPIYEKALQFESAYIFSMAPTPPLSSVSSITKRTISDPRSLGRTQSTGEQLLQIPLGSPKLSHELSSHQLKFKMADRSYEDLLIQKSKSYKPEKRDKCLNKTFDASNKPMRRKEHKRGNGGKLKKKSSTGDMLNHSIRSTGSVLGKNKKERESQAIIHEKLEDEKGDTDGSKENVLDDSIKKSSPEVYDSDSSNVEDEELIRTLEKRPSEKRDENNEVDGDDEGEGERENHEEDEWEEHKHGDEDENEYENEYEDEGEEEEKAEDEEDSEEEEEEESEIDDGFLTNFHSSRKDLKSSISAIEADEPTQERTKNKVSRRFGRKRFSKKRNRNRQGIKNIKKFSFDI